MTRDEIRAIEPAPQAAFDQEIKDSDELLRLLNLPPDRYRTDGGCINLPKVRAAVRKPWNYPTIDPVNPPVQSSVGAAPLLNCILCANGNDLPEGEYCRGCGRSNESNIKRAVRLARGSSEPPSMKVGFAAPSGGQRDCTKP